MSLHKHITLALVLLLGVIRAETESGTDPNLDFNTYEMYMGRWSLLDPINGTNSTRPHFTPLPAGLSSGVLQSVVLDSALVVMNVFEGEHANNMLQLVFPADEDNAVFASTLRRDRQRR